MSAKPTPAPWRVFNEGGVIEIQDANGDPVIFWQGFDRSERSHATHLANARLIVGAVNAHGVRGSGETKCPNCGVFRDALGHIHHARHCALGVQGQVKRGGDGV
jgi:hypothetical protein